MTIPLHLPHVASRLFGAPLMVHPEKLQAILTGLAPRFLGERPALRAMEDDGEGRAPPPSWWVRPDGVAVVPVVGALAARVGAIAPDSTEMRSYDRIAEDLRAAVADPRARAIVLDIDSPGGEAQGAMELATALRGLRGQKPIVAAVNHGAYSAGYAIASAADRIIIPPSGGVGSIGVVLAHLDVSRAEDKQGLTWTFLHAGARKIDGTAHQPLSEPARVRFAALVEQFYGQFVAAVAEGRGLTAEAVRATEADTYFGEDALAVGLADRIGTFDDALAEAAGMAAGRGRATPARAGLPARTRSPEEKPMSETNPAGADPAQPVQPTTQQPAAPPVAPDVAAITAAAIKAAQESAASIAALCQLAGQPARAAEFITQGRTPAEVQATLLAERAEAGKAGGEINATRPPPRGDGERLDPRAGRMASAEVDASWNRVGAAAFGAAWKGI